MFLKQKFYYSFLLAPRSGSPLFDEEELQSEAVQRAWQYLQLYNEDPRLIQHFNFDAHQQRHNSPEECLETLIGFVSYNFILFYAKVALFRVTRPRLLNLQSSSHYATPFKAGLLKYCNCNSLYLRRHNENNN